MSDGNEKEKVSKKAHIGIIAMRDAKIETYTTNGWKVIIEMVTNRSCTEISFFTSCHNCRSLGGSVLYGFEAPI